jgi:hypothetical protein
MDADDHELLDRLAAVVAEALARIAGVADQAVAFGPGLLAPRMALVFGRPRHGYWALHQAVYAACQAASNELVPSWGPHLTLTRFAMPAPPAQAEAVLQALSS